MTVRFVTGIVGVLLFIVICMLPPVPFLVALELVMAVGILEAVTAYRALTRSPVQTVIAWSALIYPVLVAAASHDPALHFAAVVAPAAVVMALLEFGGRSADSATLPPGARRFYGVLLNIWLGGTFAGMAALYAMPHVPLNEKLGTPGGWLLLLASLCVTAVDTAAFLVGKKWGRRLMAPKLSPKKTWEGAAAGFVAGILAGLGIGLAMHVPAVVGISFGFCAGFLGQCGDLFESLLKRTANVKDFGSIVVGHGGILDRLDSLMFTAPACALLFLLLVQR
ncbi:MAG: phosphatidate cytidylyltransferase [Armatimonadetes bacterium]|nr:phosphatidate cytidylyltransferase [Armatimonadota bacterium]MDE2205123.1 phosphatidate cytidylyltransferase [Armatimonadota bacterium]